MNDMFRYAAVWAFPAPLPTITIIMALILSLRPAGETTTFEFQPGVEDATARSQLVTAARRYISHSAYYQEIEERQGLDFTSSLTLKGDFRVRASAQLLLMSSRDWASETLIRTSRGSVDLTSRSWPLWRGSRVAGGDAVMVTDGARLCCSNGGTHTLLKVKAPNLVR
ncbi:hypothetical protein LTR27_007538 [Elasticomyces elasticus]|nr:hypothetical protein LTR27_007538 [Elasticomyces elasticus]